MAEKKPLVFMPDKKTAPIHVALIGGGDLCLELLEKTTFEFEHGQVKARIVAVSDPDPQAPGMALAKKMGLKTVVDYHDLYQPEYDIQLIVILVPDPHLLSDVLNTRPANIRILSCEVFELFWKAIGIEENKLRERNREVETILDGIQDFILVINPQMDIIDVNETFLRKMCYRREEVIGRKCHEVFQKANLQCSQDVIVCPLNEAIRNQRPSQNILTRVNNRGDLRYIEVTIYPIWEKSGKVSKFIEISRDVTGRKKEEEEMTQRLEQMVAERTRQLKETHDKLLHQDKMASLGKLSASVVHEINNPIAGVLNLILLIKRIMEEDTTSKLEATQLFEYLSLMENETRRISRIVSNLLAFSRQTKVTLSPTDINRLVDKSLLLNANLLKIHHIQVEKRYDADLPSIVGSDDQLLQVFMNIISNSVEAMEFSKDARLTVETRLHSGSQSVQVVFSDTGIGIPEQNLSRLFEPFFTTKKKGKGVGLGLSVAYGIIQEHGGMMHVTSEVGKGTVFTIDIPLEPNLESPNRAGGPQ